MSVVQGLLSGSACSRLHALSPIHTGILVQQTSLGNCMHEVFCKSRIVCVLILAARAQPSSVKALNK